jgi:hypothetical protein
MMTTPVVRVYGTEQQASDAVARLKEYGFPEEGILTVSPVAGGEADAGEAVWSAARSGFVLQERARRYADAVRQGQSLVAVRPPFGRGQVAIDILDGLAPISTGFERHGPEILWDVAAPLSSGLRAPALWRGQPAPFSLLTGGEILVRGRTFAARYPELTRPDWTFSSRMGLPLLSRSQAPRSSLSAKAGPSWTRSLGLPLLASGTTPFSSGLGLGFSAGPLRFDQPAPFSAMLGLQSLRRGRSILSRLFGELGSPHYALFGRNSLSSDAAPFSGLIAQPLLWQEAAPLSARTGQPTLRQGGAPFSSALTLPLLWRTPTPLSSLLRLSVLSRYQ